METTSPLRTIRRYSRPLHVGKWQALTDLVRSYAQEKDAHLIVLGQDAEFAGCVSDRTRRDALVAEGYASPSGLQARAWKMALKDAYETIDKQWAALAALLRPRVAQHAQWSDQQKRYAYWLLQSPARLAQLADGPAPLPEHFEIAYAVRKTVQNYLRRVIRRRRGESPRAKLARALALDANMYEVFEQDGAQYIKVMSLAPRQRIVIPMTGNTPIRGNIRLVLDEERRRVEIHYTATIKPAAPLTGEPCGLDAGISEVFTDEHGNRYGEAFGKVLARASDELRDKGRKRNKLYRCAKKADAPGKAGRIRKFNLGRKKQHRKTRCHRTEVERQINAATRQVLEECQPAVLVTEKLDIRGKAKSKGLSRRVSLWARGVLNERVDFLASARGSRREQVNPAYSSQTCPVPTCGYVYPGNRRGDAFQCLHCGHADDADRVAAHNLKARYGDAQIFLWTPKERVKAILLDRFTARLETSSEGTVAGRTPGVCECRGQPRRRAKRLAQSCTSAGVARENAGAKCGQTHDHV